MISASPRVNAARSDGASSLELLHDLAGIIGPAGSQTLAAAEVSSSTLPPPPFLFPLCQSFSMNEDEKPAYALDAGSSLTSSSKEKDKGLRQGISCAECRRLKLRCSRTWPCTSCVKRGCAQVCPSGIVRTGKGKRLILAETEELHSRITELELALAQAHARYSDTAHPLLATSSYLYTPRDFKADPLVPGAEGDGGPGSGAAGAGAGAGAGTDAVDSTFGTLTIGEGGQARFVGAFGGSEYLQETRQGNESEGEGDEEGQTDWQAETSFQSPFSALPGPTTHSKAINIDEMRLRLPDWEPEGRHLVQCYWDNASWMYQIMPRTVFESKYLLPAYNPAETINPHNLACVFIVMAIGVMFDLDRKPFDSRRRELFDLGTTCLESLGLKHATPSTVRALHLCGTYILNDKGGSGVGAVLIVDGSGAETFWPILGCAVKVAYGLGLHRDGSAFGLSAEEVQERRLVWWELVTYERLQASCFARPSAILNRTMDTKFPERSDHLPDIARHHETKYRLMMLMEKVIGIQTQITPVPYAMVQQIDQELVDFQRHLPDELLPNTDISEMPTDPSVPPHLVIQRLTMRLLIIQSRLLLSRPFFARALIEDPINPARSKHGALFTALYDSANDIVNIVRQLVMYHPDLIARWWFFWFHAFSSACCLAALVIRAPRSIQAAAAFTGMTIVCDISTSANEGCRAKRGLPILLRLRARAQQALLSSYSAGPTGAKPNRGSISEEPEPSARGEDDLSHLTGEPKLRRISSSRPRPGRSASTSGTRHSEAEHLSPTPEYVALGQLPQHPPASQAQTVSPTQATHGLSSGNVAVSFSPSSLQFNQDPSPAGVAAAPLSLEWSPDMLEALFNLHGEPDQPETTIPLENQPSYNVPSNAAQLDTPFPAASGMGSGMGMGMGDGTSGGWNPFLFDTDMSMALGLPWSGMSANTTRNAQMFSSSAGLGLGGGGGGASHSQQAQGQGQGQSHQGNANALQQMDWDAFLNNYGQNQQP